MKFYQMFRWNIADVMVRVDWPCDGTPPTGCVYTDGFNGDGRPMTSTQLRELGAACYVAARKVDAWTRRNT